MPELWRSLLDSEFLPHAHCFLWKTNVLWLHVVSDAVVAMSYYTIPIALVYIVRRRRDAAYRWMYLMFAAFILACGTTHLMAIVVQWKPYYTLEGVIKLATALISIATAAALFPLLPAIAALPSPALLAGKNRELEREVHERKKAEEQLRLLVDSVRQSAFFMLDAEGRVASWNLGAERLTGYRADEVLGQPFSVFVAAEEHEQRRDVLHRASRDGQFRGEGWRLRKDGTRFWAEVTITALRDDGGALRGFAKVTRDVTERRQAEEQRVQLYREQAARLEAQEANRMKDEFLATLSHELRTPLNTIVGWVALVRGGELSEAQVVRALEVIERNAGVQTQLISDILDLSRITSGKVHLSARAVDLAKLVELALDSLRPTAAAKGITLDAALDGVAGAVLADPDRLQQVAFNLVGNAVKFTPRGGRVSVSLASMDAHVELTVEDDGIGIAPDVLPHVFEPFRQADSSSTRSHTGLGLGLAIVRELVELHGGSVLAHSDGLGRGARFVVRLPLLAAAPDAAIVRAALGPGETVRAAAARLDGVSVLVVDDDEDSLALIVAALSDAGADVVGATSAAEAFERLRERRPDVLVSDIGMPGADGYALMRWVRDLDPSFGGLTPAVALTAYARPEDRVTALMAGFQHHVAKPVTPRTLVAIVASLAARARGPLAS